MFELFILLPLSIQIASGNTTGALSEGHVIEALNAYREDGHVFPAMDFYSALIQNGSEISTRTYVNVYDYARFGGAIPMPHNIPQTTEKHTFDWLEDFKDGDSDVQRVANKVAEILKSNQSVVDYYLYKNDRVNNVTTEDPEDEMFLSKRGRQIAEAMDKYSNEIKAYKFVPEAWVTPLPDFTIHETATATSTETPSKIATDLDTDNTAQRNCSSSPIDSNRFILKLKKIVSLFKRSTAPQTTTATSTTRKSLKRKLTKHIYAFLNSLTRTRKFISMTLGIGDKDIDDSGNSGFFNRILQHFQRNKSVNQTQNPPKRRRRNVYEMEEGKHSNNQTEQSESHGHCSQNSKSSGVFGRIKNFFWPSKKYDPKTRSKGDVENKEVQTDSTSLGTIQSKLPHVPMIYPTWPQCLDSVKNMSDMFYGCTTDLMVSHKQLHVSEEVTCSPSFLEEETLLFEKGKQVTTDFEKNTTYLPHKTTKTDILLENAKKIIHGLYNTSEPLQFTKVRDFIACLSTKVGQKWWEALHENDQSDEMSEDTSESEETYEESSEKTTKNRLWNFFQKSLRKTTKKLKVISQTDHTIFHSNLSRGTTDVELRLTVPVKSVNIPETRLTIQALTTTTLSCTTNGLLWKYFQRTLGNVSSSTIFNLNGKTYYGTQSAVFTYKRKTRTTSTPKPKESECDIISDEPENRINGTFDYEHFCQFMRSTLCEEYRVFFTDTFPSTQPTIKKSLFERIKKIFRGGKNSDEVKQNKTSSEEDLDHYKNLCDIYAAKGNITQEEFNKRKLGNIKLG